METLMTFEKLIENVKTYIRRETDLARLEAAYQLSSFKHAGQVRKSGAPYITHPLAVAYILSELSAGPNTLIAALLHDTLEDTNTTYDDLKNQFGEEVAQLVDGVTKIGKISYNQSISQADNHQKMLLAMGKDIRVVLIKIADRLHNMRTIHYQSSEKQLKIANETLEIYAPLAHRLGLFKIKAELEDSSLRIVNGPFYHRIKNMIENQAIVKNVSIEHMMSKIKEYLGDHHVEHYQISGRTKNIYSIYKKMTKQNKDFEDIYDILAIRVIVDRIEDCYQVLGIIHAHFIPIPKRFKDYIAVPKPNMYQSLHTTILSDDGSIFEVQIRTYEMDKVAEYGIAAHWAYKESKEYSKEKEQFEIAQKLKWYADLLKMSEDADDKNEGADEFVETVKNDILEANVYVFTPKGQVVELTKGSTPIDFAYRIHSDVGNKMVGASVNNRIVPLDYELQTGDIVAIRTSKNVTGPSEDWLKMAKSSHARHKIKGFLNKLNKDNLLQMGKDMIEREAAPLKLDLNQINDEFVSKHFSKNMTETVEDLYVEVGKGIISPKTVIAKLSGKELDKDTLLQRQLDKAKRILTTNHESGLIVEGLSTPQIKIANCCLPVPGDSIVGYVTKGSGIAVHHENCPNVKNLTEMRFVDVYWATNITRKYPTRIQIIGQNRENILSEIISTINATSLTIAEINAISNAKLESIITLKVLASNKAEIENVMVNLMKISNIYHIERRFK
ncbi:bifunctional (p)ppGpp synthetase/guanosine-3',5'-bis(diphosphate) 3'-pyrophosphohydrolase [Acholeplasma vituli]|uniref:Bifunctional (P)ppGpp synthetase/guanosine-3',5'-bis(Diphosphate) 3'-pyrophosphohydrolase n=1 Tax=Paracholeplasma vituli TaxID=69473 RepID=A0ABT2PYV2_9MOLU|nr:bifunctional (p)ppGpp synthetase/guanosine-3',5'-bis(diphosphate) 3'-pyrophosphohydrolase [Paracholeplasma vituli]MCU0104843.1 bifunctional (p)ppGpp synthetase/guanosine-3',5'-bis(diphosphate) 3'-pyrophosphohydrolase [Paracholeplasma vituli]